MIELNYKTQQDFLNREWVRKLLDAGVDMSDAKYYIFNGFNGIDYITYNQLIAYSSGSDVISTYTVSELLYKLHEWIWPVVKGVHYQGGLDFIKDAPFYIFFYHLYIFKNREKIYNNDEYLYAACEYPIESLASLLIQCHEKGIGDIGNISTK